MLRFTKMHGAGNDYVFIDGREESKDWPAVSVAMSDRHTGIGADGIILALPSDRAHLRMQMFNADGSEGKMCGNGIRCLVDFALQRDFFPADTSPVVVDTLAGERRVTPIFDGPTITRALVEMGEPLFSAKDVPVDVPGVDTVMDYRIDVAGQVFHVSCVSMGNPHAVAFVDTPVAEVPLHEIGPQVEHLPMFPERVNFEVVNVIDRETVTARVWERGSGLTMACGTGACAVVAVGRVKGLTGDEVTVGLPGGDLVIRWPGSGQLVMGGTGRGGVRGRVARLRTPRRWHRGLAGAFGSRRLTLTAAKALGPYS